MSAQNIVDSILQFVGQYPSARWYVGITGDLEERLYRYHQVRQHHPYIYVEAFNDAEARLAEATLLHLGFEGGSGGGYRNTIYVYAFRMDMDTVR